MSAPNAVASSSKPHKERKSKHGKHEKDHKRNKEHKHKHKSSSASKPSSVEGPFELRVSRIRLTVPPKFAADWLEGVREMLDGMLMRYVPQIGGVLLAHWEHEFIDDTVKLINECPFGVCEVQFHSVVWAPQVGQVLYGTHSLSSPSHLSLLFAKTFNVSIPLQHIPLDQFEFEHTVAPEDEPEESSDESDAEDDVEEHALHEVGRWKELGSGKLLGGAGERVKFTVIGMQVANQMLALTGSLLADPANPPPVPAPAIITAPRSPSPEIDIVPVERPAKAVRVATTPKGKTTPARPKPVAAPVVPVVVAAATTTPALAAIDESSLNPRELKKLRKEQEKAKRDARKQRKEGAGGGGDDIDDSKEENEPAAVQAARVVAAILLPTETPLGKRKAERSGESERKKKRNDTAA